MLVGRKGSYPLSYFLRFLMINSAQTSYQHFKERVSHRSSSAQCNTINGVKVWELASGEGALVCYALSEDALHPYAMK